MSVVQSANNNRDKKTKTESFLLDYQVVHKSLFSHLLKQNSHMSERVIFDKTQKILARVTVMCFCEDYELLPKDSFRNIVRAALTSLEPERVESWIRLKRLFRSFETGDPKSIIHDVDSGLFQPDNVLDQLIIRDHIFKTFFRITGYNFSTDVDVNVLGYLFEQSLQAREDFTDGDTYRQGKRKRDGIYYTSSDITELLLQETLLRWIDDSKQKLKKCHTGQDVEGQTDVAVQEYLKSVTILDPAVGSGAFLNRAYDTLQAEWNKITEQSNEHNITDNLFGVDLDEQGLGLARLSLSLKSAAQRQDYSSVDNNLKTGNAIISWSAISEQALDWQVEFPGVMSEGGFDIIIGNPPYVFTRHEGFTRDEKNYMNHHYKLTEYQLNTYLLFIERSYYLLKEGGWLGFIVPNNLLTIDSCKKMRRFLLTHTGNLTIINIHQRMFDQASVDTCLLVFQKTAPTTVKLGELKHKRLETVAEVSPERLLDEQSIINMSFVKNKQVHSVMAKIEDDHLKLDTVATVKSGLVAYEVDRGNPKQTTYMKENRVYHSECQVDDTYWMYLEGRDVCRYHVDWSGNWLKYGPNLAAKRVKEIFTRDRILVRQIPSKSKYAIHAVYTKEQMLNDRNSNNIFDFKRDPFFLLGVINSKITTFWFIHKFDKFQRKTFPQLKVNDLRMFPIPDVSDAQIKQISEYVEEMLNVQHGKSKTSKTTNEEKLLNEEIDRLVANAFGLSDEDLQLIDANLEKV